MPIILSSPTTITVQPAPPPGTSALSMLAASMPPGTWAQMSPVPTGLSNFVGGPTSGVKTGYSDKMAYDPVGKRIYWIGCDHNQAQTFMQYDEASNAWTVLPATPFAAATKHGYNHSTWDTTNGRLYHKPFGAGAICRWDGGSNWTSSNFLSYLGYDGGAMGCEFFPELNSVIVFGVESGTNGAIAGYNVSTNKWSRYAGGLAMTGAYHNVARYSKIHQLVWFGGGNGGRNMWTIDKSGVVTAKAPTPAALPEIGCGNRQALAVNDPSTGNFIVIGNSSTWFDFNPVSNSWTQRSGTAQVLASPTFDSSQPTWATVAVTIHQYQVIAFIKAFSREQPAQMWLFKP